MLGILNLESVNCCLLYIIFLLFDVCEAQRHMYPIMDSKRIFWVETKHCGYSLSCDICGLVMPGNRYQRIPSAQLPMSSTTYPKTVLVLALTHFEVICGDRDANTVYGTNAIRTTRYNLLNCIPLYLWDVFNPKYKLANIFFLLVSILQCTPSISLTNGLPSSLPSLLTIIGAEAVHMGILEHKRRKSDKEMNSRKVVCWDTNTHEWKERMWKEICVCFGNW